MLKPPGAIAPDRAPRARKPLPPLVIGAIGIVFGDIGTSPLYTLRECFTGPHGLPLTPDNVLGILSVVFWAIMMGPAWVRSACWASTKLSGGIFQLVSIIHLCGGAITLIPAGVRANRISRYHFKSPRCASSEHALTSQLPNINPRYRASFVTGVKPSPENSLRS
jgi:hypothetical protein